MGSEDFNRHPPRLEPVRKGFRDFDTCDGNRLSTTGWQKNLPESGRKTYHLHPILFHKGFLISSINLQLNSSVMSLSERLPRAIRFLPNEGV